MNIKEMRISKHLTQEQAADLLQVSRRTYINYEQEKVKVSESKKAYICRVLEEYGKIDETHGILLVEDIKNICENVLNNYNVDFCYLFGSYAKGNAKENSDVDLFISMDSCGEEFYDLSESLRENLKKKVDLIHITQINKNVNLAKEIMKYGIKIYG